MGSSGAKALVKVISFSTKASPGERIIIFSNFLKFLDIIARVLKEYLGLSCLRFDSTMDRYEKQNALEIFKTDGNDILLLKSEAGSLGLNLECGSEIEKPHRSLRARLRSLQAG